MLERALRPVLLATILVASLLADPATAAVDPHPRESPAMSMGTTITSLDMATVSGLVLAGRADPGRSFGDPANQAVWRLWDTNGNELASGRADATSCAGTTTVPPLGDMCIGDVTDVAISSSGTRFVVAARGNTATSGRILFIHQSGGAITTVANRELTGEAPTTIAMNGEGTQVVVGTDRGGTPATGRVRAYDWTSAGTGTVTDAWATDTATAITDLALGNDRITVAAGGVNHYRFTSAGAVTTDTSPSEQGAPVSAVAIGRVSPDHWSAASTTAGELLLTDDSHAAQPQRVVSGTSPKRALAMSNDNLLVAAGDDAGVVRLFANCNLQSTPCTYDLQSSVTLAGGVTALAFSQDGHYLAVGTQQGTSLLRVASSAIQLAWTHTTGVVVDVNPGSAATVVASAAGSSVTVFTVLRAGTMTASGNGNVAPGTTTTTTLTVRNTGNRDDTFAMDAPTVPTGWTATLSRSTLTLAPDATGTVLLNVSVPTDAAPGAAKVTVALRVAGLAQPLDVAFSVAQTHRWLLGHDGPSSVSVGAGATVTFPFRATNIGNGADTTTVTYTLDRAGWTASVSPSTLTAGAGDTANAVLTLTAPANPAGDPESAAVTLRLDQDADAILRLTATVGAQFAVEATADPATSNGVGGVANLFVVHVRNAGNAPDAFVVTLSGLPSGWEASAIPGLTQTLAPGASSDVTIQIVPPTGVEPGSYGVAIRVASRGDPSRSDTAQHTVDVDGSTDSTSTTSKKGSKGSPGPALPLLALALAAVAVARRK